VRLKPLRLFSTLLKMPWVWLCAHVSTRLHSAAIAVVVQSSSACKTNNRSDQSDNTR
jgi:hypothetical protein